MKHYEDLNPQQQSNYDDAVALAHLANNAHNAAKAFASKRSNDILYPYPYSNRSSEEEFVGYSNQYEKLKKMCEILLPGKSAFEDPADIKPEPGISFKTIFK